MSTRRLYAHPFSNNSMRAQLSLDEKGLDYEYVKCFRRIGEFHQKLDPKNIFASVKFRKQRRAELGDRVDVLLKECGVWEGYLGEAPYFAGDAYSIADIVVLPFFTTVIDGLGLPAATFPRLHAWYERVKARPSVARQPWFEAFAADKANAEQRVLELA
jgi:glutathione S-transferase